MKKIMTLLALFFATVLAAQTVAVKDNATLQPIEKAYVYYKPASTGTTVAGVYTNTRGEATLSGVSTDSIVVLHASYGRQAFSSKAVAAKKNTIFLVARSMMLNEVIYSVNKSEEKKSEIPYSITVIDAAQIQALNPQTSADMLANSGQVFVQKSQMGGGSPVLRGFESSRVLLVVDGVRMNNAIYRSGHLQDAITIDPNMLERTEVLFGPSSVVYGSDALGGTMLFYSRLPQLASNDTFELKAGAYLRFSSANNEQTGHLDFNLGGKRWASITSFTRSEFGDLRQGAKGIPFQGDFGWCKNYVLTDENGKDSMYVNDKPLVQKFTGYSQMDVMQKFLYRPNEHTYHLLNIQYSTSSDIPRYDRLQQYSGNTLRFAEWSYGPQNRLLASYTLNLNSDERKLYNNARFIVAAQKIDQDRINRRFGNLFRSRQSEDVVVVSLNADFKKNIGEKHDL
ncbi:MAG: TonB-dependent receptor plug domain-containing protein, partial [Bacteroidia bacterium]